MSHSPPHSRTPPTSVSPPRRLTWRRAATSPPRRAIDYSPSRGPTNALYSYPSSSSLASLYLAHGRISPVRRSPAHSRCSSRDQDGVVLCDELRTLAAVIPRKISSLSTTPIPTGGPIPPPTPPPASPHDDIDDLESSGGSDEEIVFQRGRRRPIPNTDIDGLTTPQSRHVRSSRVLRRVRANIHEVSPSGSGSVSPPTVPAGVSAPPTPPKDAAPSGLHHPKSLKRSPKSAYFADSTEVPGLKEHLGREEQNSLDLEEFVWKDEVDHTFAPYIPRTAPAVSGDFLEPKEVEEEQVSSVGELEGSLEENVEIHEALYAEFAMAHEIGIALGSPPAVERRLEFVLDPEHDTSGDDKSVNSNKSVDSIKSEMNAPEPEPESEPESEYESEPEHSIPGAFKDEDEVLAEINGLKKKGRGKGKAKAEVVAITQEEIDSGESTKEEEDENESETGQYLPLGATIAKARINGTGGRKVTPWPTPRIISCRSSMENAQRETADPSESVREPAEEVAEKAASEEAAETESADTDENDFTDEEEDDDEVFYDAEEGGLASPPMSPISRSYSHSRHAELENLPRTPRSPKSPKSPRENNVDLVLTQSASEASAPGLGPGSPNSPKHPEAPKKLPLPLPGPLAVNVIPATPVPLMSPAAELDKQLGNPPPSLLHRKPTGGVQTLKNSHDPTSPTKPSIPVPKRSTSFSMSGTRKTARRPSISNQPKRVRESKLHPWWRPRHGGSNDAEDPGLSRTISAPHISAYTQELHRTESTTSIGRKRVTKPIKGTKFQIEFIGVGTIKEKGGVLKEKLDAGSGAMKRKFSLKKRPTDI
ncbi:unnamed protein product [Tuber melanosporum]|uniref:(Perigord truffle) hypothetical protein n=1 Tax=Tuber melanosporum (strain Mel28) TaxID=656061 RepID=D5G8F8_TUBMM|nr:uncharacterized protein GSTUM_00004806001 [Tuber melanosporum]CAZ80801.1 unnamed protein product [Tuber melanosporum]